jgi:hypothetical protein
MSEHLYFDRADTSDDLIVLRKVSRSDFTDAPHNDPPVEGDGDASRPVAGTQLGSQGAQMLL